MSGNRKTRGDFPKVLTVLFLRHNFLLKFSLQPRLTSHREISLHCHSFWVVNLLWGTMWVRPKLLESYLEIEIRSQCSIEKIKWKRLQAWHAVPSPLHVMDISLVKLVSQKLTALCVIRYTQKFVFFTDIFLRIPALTTTTLTLIRATTFWRSLRTSPLWPST